MQQRFVCRVAVSRIGKTLCAACIACSSTPGLCQEDDGVLVTVVRSEGYSESGAVFVQQGAVIHETAAWTSELPFFTEFALPSSTYRIVIEDLFDEEIVIGPGDEVVVDINVRTSADGRHDYQISLAELRQWEADVDLLVPYRGVVALESLEEELSIEVKPSHPLAEVNELDPRMYEDVLAMFEKGIVREDLPYSGSRVLQVKDMVPPPVRRPGTPLKGPTDGQP